MVWLPDYGVIALLFFSFTLVVSIYLDWQMDNAHGNVGKLVDSGLSGGGVIRYILVMDG